MDAPIGFTSLKVRVIIFGCGYVGKEFARTSVQLGWEVTALTRNHDTASDLRKIGVRTVTGLLQSDDWWKEAEGAYDHVVNCVGAASPSLAGYRESYLHGMESILGWMREKKIGAQNLLFTSSSSVYPQTDGGLVNEKSETKYASPRAQVLLEAERSCLNAPSSLALKRCVLRFSGLYGPGRHLLVDKIRRGDPMNGSPHRVLNLLHRDDAASSIHAFLQSDPSEEGGYIYNVCDGQHAKRGEIAEWVANRVGVSVPAFVGADADNGPNRRVDNAHICNELKWSPQYPDFQSGYEDFLASE